MKENEFIHTIQNIFNTGNTAALATIVRTRGSTPRKAGSKMIVYQTGAITGTVGGGCGEGEVIEKALEVINTGLPVIHEVDLTSGLLYEDGGICGGIMDVFIEPLL
ncbi:XdhC family protein [Fictibacillus sp. KU28468]|uniref:XdhC family protein n=1 Tax=Fictibacillus sp. KU28468 TaxID=2991053 RepID=UPI0006A79D55|nr:XdhC family protein [Fictibacillus sp. KU28468]UZJ77593.1 XdhC family protein [Fictibacillus sp. KU28468]